MQSYKSVKNIELERKNARRQEKQRGMLSFDIDQNTSGKIITPFTKPYAEVPFIIITPLIDDGHAFEVTVVVTSITKTDFTVNIQNTSEDVVKGTVMWYTE